MKKTAGAPRSARRDFLQRTGAALLSPLVWSLAGCAAASNQTKASHPQADGTKPPNVLLLLVDQLRFDTLGHQGHPIANTPHLDRLATSGMRLDRTYCQSPVCVPGRNSLLLGRYPHSHGVLGNFQLSNPELVSFPQVFRQNGYRTACFGKFHVYGRDGLDWVDFDDGRRKWPSEDWGGVVLAPNLDGRKPLGAPAYFPDEEHQEWGVTENAIQFLREHGQSPWMMQVSFRKPHPPFQPPKRIWDSIDRSALSFTSYPDDDLSDTNEWVRSQMRAKHLEGLTEEQKLDALQGYLGNIMFCDELFGRVLRELEALDLAQDTIVVFTADSGELMNAHGLWTKFAMFEEAVRVPLIVRFPGRVPAGARSIGLVEHIDLYPTLLELARLPVPDGVQGRSLVPLFRGEGRHRDRVICEHGSHETMLFDGTIKVIDNGSKRPPELYDLGVDPLELENRAGEDSYREILATYREEIRKHRLQDVVPPGKTRPFRQGRNRRNSE